MYGSPVPRYWLLRFGCYAGRAQRNAVCWHVCVAMRLYGGGEDGNCRAGVGLSGVTAVGCAEPTSAGIWLHGLPCVGQTGRSLSGKSVGCPCNMRDNYVPEKNHLDAK